MVTEKHTEQDVCKWAIEWLDGHGFEIYQEVESLGGRCDIVGVKGPVLLACEAKMGPSLKLLGQAFNWLKQSNLTWVATNPTRKGGLSYLRTDWASRKAFEAFLADHGIGWIELDRGTVQVKIDATLRRRCDDTLRRNLHEMQKTLVTAGGNRGGHYTPFRETCTIIRGHVEANPGCPAKDVIVQLGQLHWASKSGARIGLISNVRGGHVSGVRIDGEMRLWPIAGKAVGE